MAPAPARATARGPSGPTHGTPPRTGRARAGRPAGGDAADAPPGAARGTASRSRWSTAPATTTGHGPRASSTPARQLAAAAVRETAEETGLDVRLGRPLPASGYTSDRTGARHQGVRYWAAEVTRRRHGACEPRDRRGRLARRPCGPRPPDYASDRDQLLALVRADADRRRCDLAARSSSGTPRPSARRPGPDDDADRPLDRPAAARALDIAAAARGFGVTRLVTSPWLRCMRPSARTPRPRGARMRTKRPACPRRATAATPRKAARHLARASSTASRPPRCAATAGAARPARRLRPGRHRRTPRTEAARATDPRPSTGRGPRRPRRAAPGPRPPSSPWSGTPRRADAADCPACRAATLAGMVTARRPRVSGHRPLTGGTVRRTRAARSPCVHCRRIAYLPP